MRSRLPFGILLAVGLSIAVVLAFFVSPHASSQPDGLNRVAIDNGFAETESSHALDEAPTAGYAVKGIDDERLSTGLAGLIGVSVTFAVCAGLFVVVRQSRRSNAATTQGVL